MIRCSFMVASLWCVCIAALSAEEISPKDSRSVVELSATRYAEAFAKQDAKAIAALFTPEAEFVSGDGTIFHGRTVIEAEFASNFAENSKGNVEIELLSIRQIAECALVEEGVSTFTTDESKTSTATRYTATHVKQPDGTWLIASVRELEARPLTPHDRLEALAWLVGSWHEDVDGETISTTWKWDAGGNFLISDFELGSAGKVTTTGTHRVGWDAERKQLRSWVFDSNGSSGEGWWHVNDDGTWCMHLTQIDSEGVRTVSQLTYGAEGAETIVVSTDQTVHDGVCQPGVVHRIVRQPPAPTVPKQ